jgi:hypothetical protein
MLEYHEKNSTDYNNKSHSDNVSERPKFMSLAAQYGLNKDMEIGNSDGPEQTTEQEYQAYVTAQPSRGIGVIKFWEVHNSINDVLMYC